MVNPLSGSVGYNGMSFVPPSLVLVQIGQYTDSMYPKVDSTMPKHERAYTFQVMCSAFELLPVVAQLVLDALGTQLNCSAVVKGLMFDWRSRFDDNWYDFKNLTIQSYHNSAGARINNTATAANPSILLPVQNGAVAGYRKDNVRFVRVLCLLDFATLFTIANPGPTVLHTSFYIERPQATQMTINTNGVNYNLTTWLGAVDLSTLSCDDLRTLVLKPCPKRGGHRLHEGGRGYLRADHQARLQADLPRNLYPALPGVQRPTPHGS